MKPTPAGEMLARYGLAPSKERGQNFLVDPNVAQKIVEAVAPAPGEVVVEVGTGFGAITFGLAERARHVVTIEHDSGIARAFREEYGEPAGVTLVEGDALEFDLRSAAERFAVKKVVVAGNLPYNLTSPVLRQVIEGRSCVSRAVFMMQKEVADRLAASPGESDYSALTAVVGFHARVRPHFVVRRTCFLPRPAVDSRVVGLDLTAGPVRDAEPDLYDTVVHAAFGQRRKMLRGTLAELARLAGTTIDRLSTETGLDMSRRGETLSVEEFEQLTLALERARSGRAGGGRAD